MRRHVKKMSGGRRAGHTADSALHGQRAGPGDGLQATALTRTDIELMASVDEAHETLSGPAA